MSGANESSASPAPRRRFQLRAYRIRWPERVVGGSAAVLLAAMLFLSWFTFPPRASGGVGPKYYVVGNSEDGWHGLAHAHWLLLATILAAFALVLFQASRPAPPVPVTFSLLVMVLAALSTVWLVVRVVLDPPAGRNFGGWFGLISAVVLTWAGYASVRVEGIAPEDMPQEIPTVTLDEVAASKSEHAEPS
jgi:hypothetical protein